MITDDFTGALDTGIQFTKQGVPIQISIEQNPERISVSDTAQVLVVDLETRPLTGEQSYQMVHNIISWAKEQNIEYIFKKTDSALRGNVGAELKAVADVYGENVSFIPAFPKINRVTRGGIHYIDGIGLSESAFGKDPFEPVQSSDIRDILKKEIPLSVHCIGKDESFFPEEKQEPEILVFDAETEQDIKDRLRELKQKNGLHLLAGCSGLAEFLPEVLELKGEAKKTYEKKKGLYVACGSLNPITQQQIEYACENGFYRVSLTAEQILFPEFYDTLKGKDFLANLKALCKENPLIVVDTLKADPQTTEKIAKNRGLSWEQVRFTIAECHGKIVKYLIEKGMDYTIFMTGGDTLMGFMKGLNHPELIPVCEISQGVVLSKLKWNGKVLQVVSKSGGFGNQKVFLEAAEKLLLP